MDDLFKIFDDLIKSSNKISNNDRQITNSWKHCVSLNRNGWTIDKINRIQDSDTISIIWKKSGETDILIYLSLFDQQKWIEYMEASNVTAK